MSKRRLGFIFWLFLFCFSCGYFENISPKEYARLPILFHLDNYDDCMLLEEEALFCSVTYQLYPSITSKWRQIKEISTSRYNYRHDILRHGICVPKTCPNITITSEDDPFLHKELTKCYNDKFRSLGLNGTCTSVSCDTINPKYPIDCTDIVFGCFLLLYIFFVIYASIYEGQIDPRKNGNNKNIWERILLAFSIRSNWIRLKTINTDSDTEKFRCIQGVRFYNMILVILVHTIMTLFLTLPVANTRSTETLTERLSTVFLASGPLCVSTFFLISSWLLVNSTLKKFKDRKDIDFKILFSLFVNRYIRLTPSLALIIAFQATWLRHLGNGPNWNHVVGDEYLRCRKNWWSNIFYINNYVDPENMCMQTTWYLALDTQYFAILLLLIWYIKKNPRSIWIILGSLLALSIGVSFLENYTNDFPALIPPIPESLYGRNHTLKNKQWHIQYIGFFGNMAGPIVGLWVGYVYIKYKNQHVFTSNICIWIWYILFHGCCYGTILITGLLSLPKHITHSTFWASVHVAISRPIFAFGIGLFLFGMTQGIGGIMKRILEWHPLYVLGRLTYSAYLVHVPLLLLRGGIIRAPVYINEYSIFFELLGHVAVSYFVATIFTLLFEMPVSALQKLVFHERNGAIVQREKIINKD